LMQADCEVGSDQRSGVTHRRERTHLNTPIGELRREILK